MTTAAPETPEQAPLEMEMELEQRWILNLSMHFRDRSEREKFFVTYAETPTRWRRVTISCDYRDAGPDSLEEDLKQLPYQRDKCARIYESIRESLPDIQFYDSVTNLKVETRDGRLHVHVTEDVNETIPYPPISSIGHLRGARCIPEDWLHFDSHLSGFVYKVQLGGQSYIKKEIPGPDTVDEFLYEINALHALNGAPNVIQVEAIVVDERQQKVKGLLINYAEQGALVDILYEERGRIPFGRRERWAKQIVQGLCEIHEAGYVQGDFTLSNIVVDAWDNAHIIDINRRGCPVGWEPPEIAAKIESNQRISMYIGVKTDLYQLGMTLWALAMEEDEPEREPRPLTFDNQADVPDYYRRLVDICLSPTPRHRLAAKDLLSLFPSDLFSRRSMIRHGLQDLPNEPLPLFPKSNGVDPQLATEPTSHLVPQDSFEHKFSGAHRNALPQSVFPDNQYQAKRSTPTLAGSNGDGAAAFLSRHSSASTLNHHEQQSDRSWGFSHPANGGFRSELPGDPTMNHQLQKSGPPSWTDAFDHEPNHSTDQPSPLKPSTSSKKLSAGVPPPTDKGEIIEPTHLHAAHNTSGPTKFSVSSQGDVPGDEPLTDDADVEYPLSDIPDLTPLLLSSLPINPALEIRRRSFPAVAKDVQPAHAFGQSNFSHQKLVESLLESRLPINPALLESQEGVSRAIVLSETPLPMDPVPVEGRSGFPSFTSLSESRLPINPAFGASQEGSCRAVVLSEPPLLMNPVPIEGRPGFPPLIFSLSESRLPINPALQEGSEGYRRLLLSLFESQLPINPAFQDGNRNYRRPTTSSSDVQLSTNSAFQSRQGFPPLAFSLSESRLPINPALRDGSEGYRRFISSLFGSQLPINPGYIESPTRLS